MQSGVEYHAADVGDVVAAQHSCLRCKFCRACEGEERLHRWFEYIAATNHKIHALYRERNEGESVDAGCGFDPEPRVGHYYPSAGASPGYGRLEIEPPANRKLPQPAESFHQSWSAQSAPPAPQPEVPFYPPPIIQALPDGGYGMPQDGRRPSRKKRH